jgi:hypothetical protein
MAPRKPVFSQTAWTGVPHFMDVTARMLASDPDERFADGAEVCRVLRLLDPRRWAFNTPTTPWFGILWVDDNPRANARERLITPKATSKKR